VLNSRNENCYGECPRASGTSLARRLCTDRRVSRAEPGRCRNNTILSFGIPDKMAARTATHQPSRRGTSRRDRPEGRLPVFRNSSKARATEPPLRQERCLGVRQVSSLRRDADDTLDSTSPLYGSAGETTGFLRTPLLLCTATSRGKDDDYRGLFLHEGGEIYFCWSEFWTERVLFEETVLIFARSIKPRRQENARRYQRLLPLSEPPDFRRTCRRISFPIISQAHPLASTR
jgi:hypothetical protein